MPRRKPTSDVGTALARLNAVQHGLTAQAPVIPGVESPEAWLAHRDAIVQDLKPVGAMEEALAERIARLDWQLRRADRVECESIAAGIERVEFDFARKQIWTDVPPSVAEAEARAEAARRCLDVIKSLSRVPPATPLAAYDVDAIFAEFARHAGQDPDEFVKGIEECDEDGRWTAGRLLAALKALAARDGRAFAEMLGETVVHADSVASRRRLEIARVREELDRMRRERLHPDGPTLDRIVRYRTAHSRMFYQAYNQLEAAQARRAGAPAPLHRIQAFGLPGG